VGDDPHVGPGQTLLGAGRRWNEFQSGDLRRKMRTIFKYLWPLPMTAMGLAVAGLTRLTGGSSRVADGTVEAWGGFAAWLIERGLARKVACATIGHVIIGINEEYVARMRLHERVHVRQYEKWGILFIPLYLASSLIAWSQGRHYYRDNVFEREAYKQPS
jgi:hypothetical protein